MTRRSFKLSRIFEAVRADRLGDVSGESHEVGDPATQSESRTQPTLASDGDTLSGSELGDVALAPLERRKASGETGEQAVEGSWAEAPGPRPAPSSATFSRAPATDLMAGEVFGIVVPTAVALLAEEAVEQRL